MRKFDVNPTAEVIDEMAVTLERYAQEMRRYATKMRETGDIDYASSALNSATNCFNNLRLDLLVARPVREFQIYVSGLEEKLDT